MRKKRGVSLIYLVLAIVVMGIIATITVSSFDNLIGQSQEASFQENMRKISDAVQTYYISVGKLPKKTETKYTVAQLKTLAGTTKSVDLVAEIEENGDSNSVFYLVDVQKIGLTEALYNISESGNNLFMNASGTNVYYVEGVKVDGIYHFSNTK